MQKCVVKDCESTDSGSSIPFHPFPENPHYRLLWRSQIKACEFDKNSVVCGLHFKPEDYDAHNQLRYDAIPQAAACSNSTQTHVKISTKGPFLVISTNGIEGNLPSITVSPSIRNKTPEMKEERLEKKEDIKEEVDSNKSTDLKACRACLAVDCKMFPLKNKKLKQAYNQVTGLKAPPTDGLPQLLCWECSSRLLSAARFRDRAKKAYDILSVLKCRHGSLNLGIIRSVNRQNMNLLSQLSHKYFESNKYNVYIDGNLTEITKSDKVDDGNESDKIDDSIQSDKVEESNTNEDEKHVDEGLEVFHENFEGVNVKSEYINEPVKDVGNNDILMKNDEIVIDNDSELSSFSMTLSPDDEDDDDIESIKIVKKKANNSTNALRKQVKTVTIKKPKERPSRMKPPETDVSKFFTFTTLKLEDAIASIQKRKQSEAFKTAPFKCDLCFRGYASKALYDVHSLKHTDKFGTFECLVCKVRLSCKAHLASHSRLHRRRFSCTKCEYVTATRSQAADHCKGHEGSVHQCPQCPKQFSKRTSYYSHLRVKHACEFACDLCGHTFLNKTGMLMHRRRRHVLDNQTPEGPYCEACDVTFASQTAYDTHLKMSSKHNKDSDGSIRNAYSYESGSAAPGRPHRRPGVFPTLKPVTCELCGVTLDNKFGYAAHFRRKHPTETRTQHPAQRKRPAIVCEVCGKTMHSSALKVHMAIHNGETKICDYCGKAFLNKYCLINHMRVHQHTRPTYPCQTCGKQYTDYSNMKRHFRTHTTPAPYECDICNKRLTTYSGLRDHINHVHNGLPWPKRTRTRTTDKTGP